jgi:exosortase/archaeosortase family protein
MEIELYRLIQNFIVPIEAKMVTVVLRAFRIPAFPTPTSVNIGKPTTIGNNVTISWNCIGWQSFILLVITLITGLQGSYRLLTKIQTIIIGVLGTFLFNILRVSLVIIIAHLVSSLAAIIFHDYLSNLMIIFWLFGFWWFAYTFVLEREALNE